MIELIDSVLPLLTKCRPNDEDLDIDEKRVNLHEQFQAEIQAEMVNHEDYQKVSKSKEAAQRVEEEDDDLNDEIFEHDFQELCADEAGLYQQQKEEDRDRMLRQFEEQKHFFEEFANKLEIYDPLDRTITDFEEMSIKREETSHSASWR